MKFYKRILFPTDFSECANEAFEYALLMANMYKAELHIFHAIVTYADTFSPEYSIPYTLEINSSYPAELKKHMDKYVAKYGISEDKVIKKYKTGYATAPTIIDYIKKNNIDLVIMGTHGRRGFRHMLLGSVAEELLKTAPCHVITIRKDHNKSVPKHILVPTDYSDHSQFAISEGYNIAQKFGANLTLLHVIEYPVPSVYYITGNEMSVDHLHKTTAKTAKEKLSKLGKEAGIFQNYNMKVIKGHVANSITQFASDNKVNLIVMGSHGYSGLTHFPLGSTAEKVLRIANCPVMIVKQ